MSTQTFHHIHLWNPPSSCPFSPSVLPPPFSPSPFPPHHCPSPHLPVPIPPSQSPPPRCHLSSHPPSFLSSPSPPHSWTLPVPQHPFAHSPSPTDIYDHLLIPTCQSNNSINQPQSFWIKKKKKKAPQSRHATTVIEFLLVYSSKMTFEANGT